MFRVARTMSQPPACTPCSSLSPPITRVNGGNAIQEDAPAPEATPVRTADGTASYTVCDVWTLATTRAVLMPYLGGDNPRSRRAGGEHGTDADHHGQRHRPCEPKTPSQQPADCHRHHRACPLGTEQHRRDHLRDQLQWVRTRGSTARVATSSRGGRSPGIRCEGGSDGRTSFAGVEPMLSSRPIDVAGALGSAGKPD